MFIVKRKGEVLRLGFFLLLMGLMAYFVMTTADSFRGSAASGPQQPAAATATPGLSSEARWTPPAAADGRDFYAEARLSRDQNRSLRKQELNAMVDNTNIDADVRKAAAEELRTVMRWASLETQAEALIRGRGVADVLVNLMDGAAVVYVKADDASQQQAVQVADAVAKVTGLKLTAVSVRFQQ